MQKITAVYFSPTGNSKRYASAVAEEMGETFATWDLTKKENRETERVFTEEDFVIFAMPVYSGRIPQISFLEHVSGKNTPAVCLVTYGNRAYEDALLEWKNLCEKKGFHVIGAGAFIGEHTFSEVVGADRPNENDWESIKALATYSKNMLETGAWKHVTVTVKGNIPYKEVKKMPFAPQPNENCCRCGSCVKKCPVDAISSETFLADAEKCILCFACVKGCTRKGRGVAHPQFSAVVERLEKNLRYVDQEAEVFLAEEK